MSINKNNGLFERIKNTVALSETDVAPGQKDDRDIDRDIDRDLDIKQKQKFKQDLELAKEQHHKELKAKYSKTLKSLLQKREKELASKYQIQKELEKELQQRISKLQAELNNQFDSKHESDQKLHTQVLELQQEMQASLEKARLKALQEQEKDRSEIMLQLEQKFQNQSRVMEEDLQREHAVQLKQQSEMLAQEYQTKLHAALSQQEQELNQKHINQLSTQNEQRDIRTQKEIETAVNIATQSLQVSFNQERTQLQSVIEGLRPEVEANRIRMRSEIENDMRVEFAYKIEQLKLEMQQTQAQETEAMLAAEKQKLAESLQEENLIVLKYKEIEIKEAAAAKLTQDTAALKQHYANLQQNAIQDALQQQEQALQLEQQQLIEKIEQQGVAKLSEQQRNFEQTLRQLQIKHEQQVSKLNADHDEQQQLAVTKERTRLSEQNTNEKTVLLNQQKQRLQSQFEMEKQQLLEKINSHQIDLEQLELRLTTEHQQNLHAKVNQAVTAKELELQEAFSAQLRDVKQNMVEFKDYELEKKLALQELEASLRVQFTSQLQQAKNEWQQQSETQDSTIKAQLEQQEKELRREFQALLVAQRKQAAANYSKQLDNEIIKAITEYKQQITEEIEADRVKDFAAYEDDIKQKFESRLKQQVGIAKSEIERIKQNLQAEQREQVEAAVAVKTEKLRQQYETQIELNKSSQEEKLLERVEAERKKINLRFAQDKAVLIKDLSSKFSREAQIEMHKYETELRDKLYKEMVKQKDYIQQKFSSTQEAALNEQKRRIQAQHKQEIERIKQGYFEPHLERTQHEQIVAERGVEQLADKILAKFQAK